MLQEPSWFTAMAQYDWGQFQWLSRKSPQHSAFSPPLLLSLSMIMASFPHTWSHLTFMEHAIHIWCSPIVLTITSVARLLTSIYSIGKGDSERPCPLLKDTQLIRGSWDSDLCLPESYILPHSLCPDQEPQRDLSLPSCDSAPDTPHPLKNPWCPFLIYIGLQASLQSII